MCTYVIKHNTVHLFLSTHVHVNLVIFIKFSAGSKRFCLRMNFLMEKARTNKAIFYKRMKGELFLCLRLLEWVNGFKRILKVTQEGCFFYDNCAAQLKGFRKKAFYDGLNLTREFTYKGCSEAAFSAS